jgi:hypothetical protein
MFATRIVAMLVFAAATSTAVAQSPAPADAGAAALAALCPKPDPHPGRVASDQKRRTWTKDVNTWQECMKKHIAELQAKSEQAVKAANAANAETTAAITTYNAAVKEFQAQAAAAAD